MNSAVPEFSEAAIWISGVPPSELPGSHREQNFLLVGQREFFFTAGVQIAFLITVNGRHSCLSACINSS